MTDTPGAGLLGFGDATGTEKRLSRHLRPRWRLSPHGFLPREIVDRWDLHGRLFIHIPKAAGTSLCQAVYGAGIKHRPAWEIALFHPVRFARAVKFAVVRDPVDRFLSAYDYLRAGGRNPTDRAFGEQFLRPHRDVNAFLAAWRDERLRKQITSYFHFSRQSDYIALGGRYLIDRLARFEHLSNDLEQIFGCPLAIERKNVTGGLRTAAGALTGESLAFLEQHYAADFSIWRRADGTDEKLFLRPLG